LAQTTNFCETLSCPNALAATPGLTLASFPRYLIDREQPLDEPGDLVERQRIGTIAQGLIRVLVNLQEHPVRPGSYSSTSQRGNEAAITSGAIPPAARELHAVGRIEHHRAAVLGHDLKRPHVHH
jgi:hypothetical protein